MTEQNHQKVALAQEPELYVEVKRRLRCSLIPRYKLLKRVLFKLAELDASILVWGLTALLLCSCAGTKPLKPGRASLRTNTGLVSEMRQPENPAQSAQQSYERIVETELPLPANSKVAEVTVTQNPKGQCEQHERTYVLTEPTVQKTRVVEKVGTVIGAAQKDTARELGAKLSSLKGIPWVGVGLFLFGLASLVWPPLKMVIGNATVSVAILLGGVVLIALPSLIVGNELLILCGAAVLVALWLLAHRRGQLHGRINGNHHGKSTDQRRN